MPLSVSARRSSSSPVPRIGDPPGQRLGVDAARRARHLVHRRSAARAMTRPPAAASPRRAGPGSAAPPASAAACARWGQRAPTWITSARRPPRRPAARRRARAARAGARSRRPAGPGRRSARGRRRSGSTSSRRRQDRIRSRPSGPRSWKSWCSGSSSSRTQHSASSKASPGAASRTHLGQGQQRAIDVLGQVARQQRVRQPADEDQDGQQRAGVPEREARVDRQEQAPPAHGSLGLEHVAGAAHGVQQALVVGAVDLAPQVADVDVDDVALGVEVQAPDVLGQHRAA